MKLGYKLIGAAIIVSSIFMISCKQEVGRVVTGQTITKAEIVDAKATLGVDVNKNVSALAVRKTSGTAARTVLQNSAESSRNAIDDFKLKVEDTLVALKDDGTVEEFFKPKNTATGDSKYQVTIVVEETVTYSDGSTKTKKRKENVELTADQLRDGTYTEDGENVPYEVGNQLSDSPLVDDMLDESVKNQAEIVMPAVLETYQCRYTNLIEDEARGVYIVYEGCSTDGSVSQLSYVYPDGTVYDILNYDGKYSYSNRYLQIDQKSGYTSEKEAVIWGGNEYIQFDKRGNMYVAVYDWADTNPGDTGRTIYKFNPITKKVTDIRMGDTTHDICYIGFTVDDDGTNLFTGEKNCEKGDFEKDIYDGYTTINAYRLISGQDPVKTELFRSAVVEGACETPVFFAGKLYFLVNDWNNNRRDTGLYIASPDSNANYWKENVVVQKNATHYSIVELCFKDNYEKNNNKFNYEAILKYLFDNFCVDGDKEFRLDRLYPTKAAYAERGMEELYTDKTDVEALKYLLEDGTDNFIKLVSDYSIWDADKNGSEDRFHKFLSYMYDEYNNRFPFENLIFKKNSKETAYATSKEYYSTTLGGMNINGMKLIKSEEGVFFINEYNESKQAYEYLEVYQVCDKDGKFIGEMPCSLSPEVVKIHPYRSTNTEIFNQKDVTTWYKAPLQITEKGIAMMSSDKKSLYYYYNGVTKNVLINDPTANAIDEIMTFDATANSIFYNAKAGAKYFTKKIDLNDFSVVQVGIDDQLGSIMEYHDSKISTENYGSSAKFTVTLSPNPTVEISTTKTSTEVTLKVTNNTERAGYAVRWECMGKVLSKSDTLVMKASEFAAGTYPITVVTSKDGVIISDFISVEITK